MWLLRNKYGEDKLNSQRPTGTQWNLSQNLVRKQSYQIWDI